MIRDIKDGDTNQFNEIIHLYQKRIYASIYQMVKQTHLQNMAEDLCQETFYKAYHKLHTFQEDRAALSSWLHTIARNTVIDELRRCRISSIYLEDINLDPSGANAELPEYHLLLSEKENIVIKTISNLPKKQRTAIILKEYQGKDYVQISKMLNVTVSSVKSLLFRARNTIKLSIKLYLQDVSS